jgi:hypothetical protein
MLIERKVNVPAGVGKCRESLQIVTRKTLEKQA